MHKSNPGPAAPDFVAENTRDVIVRVSPDGRVTYVSPSVRLYGYEPADLIGGDGLDLLHPEDQASFTDNSRLLQRGETPPPANCQHRFRTADERRYRLLPNPAAIGYR